MYRQTDIYHKHGENQKYSMISKYDFENNFNFS